MAAALLTAAVPLVPIACGPGLARASDLWKGPARIRTWDRRIMSPLL